MTVFSTITEAMTDPLAPGTSELWKAWWKNPIAIAEGSPGAPRIMPFALDLFLGDISFTSTAAGLSGLDDLDGVFFFWSFEDAGSTSPDFQVRFSDDGGSTWGSYQTMLSFGAAAAEYFGCGIIGLISGKLRIFGESSGAFSTLTIPGSGANAFQFRSTAGGGSGGTATVFGLGTTT